MGEKFSSQDQAKKLTGIGPGLLFYQTTQNTYRNGRQTLSFRTTGLHTLSKHLSSEFVLGDIEPLINYYWITKYFRDGTQKSTKRRRLPSATRPTIIRTWRPRICAVSRLTFLHEKCCHFLSTSCEKHEEDGFDELPEDHESCTK